MPTLISRSYRSWASCSELRPGAIALPARITRTLHEKLVAADVPAVYVEYPQSEHAFDVGLPRLAPAAQAALYETERLLALLAAGG